MTFIVCAGLNGMTKLKFSLSMSLDGFIAGPHQSRENPLGEGGMALHEWAFAARDGGGAEAEYANLWSKNVGAVVMGLQGQGQAGSSSTRFRAHGYHCFSSPPSA